MQKVGECVQRIQEKAKAAAARGSSSSSADAGGESEANMAGGGGVDSSRTGSARSMNKTPDIGGNRADAVAMNAAQLRSQQAHQMHMARSGGYSP